MGACWRFVRLCLLVVACAGPGMARAAAPPTPALTPAEIAALVRLLGSETFAARERVTERLRHRKEAEPALRLAAGSPDPEVRRRALDLLEQLGNDRRWRLRSRLDRLMAEGEVDTLVEQVVAWPDREDEEILWDCTVRCAQRVLAAAPQNGWKTREVLQKLLPVGHFDVFKQMNDLRRFSGRSVCLEGRGPQLVRAGELTLRRRAILSGLFVVSGDIIAPRDIVAPRDFLHASRCVILLNGKANLNGELHNCLVVCDGDVVCGGPVTRCVIVSTGLVSFRFGPTDSIVLTPSCIAHRHEGAKRYNILMPGASEPMAGVRFFDPARCGLDIEEEEGAVRVVGVRPWTPFARAGLRAGDRFQAVADQAVRSQEQLRRLLRRARIADSPVALRVRRGDKDLSLALDLEP